MTYNDTDQAHELLEALAVDYDYLTGAEVISGKLGEMLDAIAGYYEALDIAADLDEERRVA